MVPGDDNGEMVKSRWREVIEEETEKGYEEVRKRKRDFQCTHSCGTSRQLLHSERTINGC